jgi:hypothetical protein
VEGSITLIEERLFIGTLHISEMLVIAQIDRLLLGEASECLGSAQFVLGSHLEGAHWTHMAVVLDCVHNKSEAVHLLQVSFGNLDFLFLRLVGVLGCLLFAIV